MYPGDSISISVGKFISYVDTCIQRPYRDTGTHAVRERGRGSRMLETRKTCVRGGEGTVD